MNILFGLWSSQILIIYWHFLIVTQLGCLYVVVFQNRNWPNLSNSKLFEIRRQVWVLGYSTPTIKASRMRTLLTQQLRRKKCHFSNLLLGLCSTAPRCSCLGKTLITHLQEMCSIRFEIHITKIKDQT